jgi:hypothetical protein
VAFIRNFVAWKSMDEKQLVESLRQNYIKLYAAKTDVENNAVVLPGDIMAQIESQLRLLETEFSRILKKEDCALLLEQARYNIHVLCALS